MTMTDAQCSPSLADLVVAIVKPCEGEFDTTDAEFLLNVVRTLLAEEVEEAADELESLASESPANARVGIQTRADAYSRAAAIIRGQHAA